MILARRHEVAAAERAARHRMQHTIKATPGGFVLTFTRHRAVVARLLFRDGPTLNTWLARQGLKEGG